MVVAALLLPPGDSQQSIRTRKDALQADAKRKNCHKNLTSDNQTFVKAGHSACFREIYDDFLTQPELRAFLHFLTTDAKRASFHISRMALYRKVWKKDVTAVYTRLFQEGMGYAGGEFLFADSLQISGRSSDMSPRFIVDSGHLIEGSAGRLILFTAGAENVHMRLKPVGPRLNVDANFTQSAPLSAGYGGRAALQMWFSCL
ncbi:hypothetical protein CYMTET_26754 [Cymbomonas tetramitiformis]|uniref:Uncharacterized protein n=1 Tax=Cymbomonas tetramitiformis TaxID=36881 RepID=A0AAE0KXK7_9CHLO|nr:hypothetical protein CYMTET_26754 [Cymbomonas tetramitiformis]